MPIFISSALLPKNAGSFFLIDDAYVRGGIQVRATLAERDAIVAGNRKAGMLVLVTADNQIYQLSSDLLTWTVFSQAPSSHTHHFEDLPLVGGKLPEYLIPAIAISDTFVVASEAAMLALNAQRGDMAVRTDINTTYVLSNETPTLKASWIALRTPTSVSLAGAGPIQISGTQANPVVGIANATLSSSGAMSAADKTKLDSIAANATAYTHPQSGIEAGTYTKLVIDAQGHATSGSNPTTLAEYGITDALDAADVEASISASLPVGSLGQVYYIKTQNTRETELGYVVTQGIFVETASELAAAQAAAVTMETVFNTWHRFSHLPSTAAQPATPSELTSWTYNTTTKKIQSTINSVSYIGFVSSSKHLKYSHEVRCSSIDGDDDTIGVLLAWYVDTATGLEYTLSALRSAGGLGFTWRVVYNYAKAGTLVVDDKTSNIKWGNGGTGATASAAGYKENQPLSGWDDFPTGTKILITRDGDNFVCKTTNLGTETYVEEATISFSLLSLPELAKFRGPSSYGYTAQSQNAASFDVISFSDTSNAIYDMRNGDVYTYQTSGWVKETVTVPQAVGVNRLVFNKTTGKLFLIESDGTSTRINKERFSVSDYRAGTYSASAKIFVYAFDSDVVFAANLNGCVVKCITAPSAAVTLTIWKNGVSAGTIAFASGATTGVITSTTLNYAKDDVMQITAPATANAAFADVMVTLSGQRV